MSASSNIGLQKETRSNGDRAKVMGSDSATENSPRTQYRVSQMEKSRGSNAPKFHGAGNQNVRVVPDRKFSGDLRNNFRGDPDKNLAFEITTKQWNDTSAAAISEFMKEENLSIKELARHIGCNDRTAENYVNGRTSPMGVYFLRCIASIPHFEAEVRRISAMAGDCDPRAEYAAMQLMQAAQRYMNVRDGAEPTASLNSENASEDSDALTGDLFEYAGRA
jgi:transcriptional regulator with XRE-family HTH domain